MHPRSIAGQSGMSTSRSDHSSSRKAIKPDTKKILWVNRSLAVVITAAGLLCVAGTGCGKHQESRTGATSGPILANPSSFPLYSHSDLINVVSIDSAQMFAAIRTSDRKVDVQKNFRGHEVIARNVATMAQLNAWLASLRSRPPAGLRLSPAHVNVDALSGDGKKPGSATINGAQFETRANTREVWVFIADPDRVRAQWAIVFGLIDNYAKMPAMLRGPVDDEAKKQVGYTVTELLDAKSPIGAAVSAIKQLQDTGQRAIVVVDCSQAK
jgi:hypothetical protein